MSKITLNLLVFFLLSTALFAQDKQADQYYNEAKQAYDLQNYSAAALYFDSLLTLKKIADLSRSNLYNGTCFYSLNKENNKALNLLEHLASERFYSNLDHLQSDADLVNLHQEKRWFPIIEQVTINKTEEPERKRAAVKKALLTAKSILHTDNGALWGTNIWNDSVLIINYDNSVFSLIPLAESTTTDSLLYQTFFKNGALSYTNTNQDFRGNKYATCMVDAAEDGTTIIHELFHFLHFKINSKLKADPINYLDESAARILLRAEFKALKNALTAMDNNGNQATTLAFLKDALVFRKIRQEKYKEYKSLELQIETVEGLANYTGVLLSDIPNKYKLAIAEIDGREAAPTYTRAFPYATGPAYGLIFDYLRLDWKSGLHQTYDFLDIYEKMYLEKSLQITDRLIKEAKARNDYFRIEKEEQEKKLAFDTKVAFYKKLLVDSPRLKVTISDKKYSTTYDMYGTLVLKDIGLVYSSASGTDLSGNNFGSYKMSSKLGENGILNPQGTKDLYFPLPIKVEGNTVIGAFYTIELNAGWEVKKVSAKGDLEVVKEE